MARIFPLLLFILWMTRTPTSALPAHVPYADSFVWMCGYIVLVMVMAVWARKLVPHVDEQNFSRTHRQFHRVMNKARYAIVAWLVFGIYGGPRWDVVVDAIFWPINNWPVKLPQVLVGTAPALLTWIGLWWAEYPLHLALHESRQQEALTVGSPLTAPSGVGRFLMSRIRHSLLFALAPVIAIMLIRDIGALLLVHFFHRSREDWDMILLPAGLITFLFAPELLRRVLETRPLAPGPLRDRLLAMCARFNLRCRDILLWHTDNNVGNAAVMGLFPRVRYVMLSDLLISRLSDEQIEAVFAHEVGHIVHRHMLWYVIFVLTLMFAFAGPGDWLSGQLSSPAALRFLAAHGLTTQRMAEWGLSSKFVQELLPVVVQLAILLPLFGYLSRHFERQADVFSARTMQSLSNSPAAPPPQAFTPVGETGAALFASALHEVAVMNDIPTESFDWLHGSISQRKRYVLSLSADAGLTRQFDQLMRKVYITVAAIAVVLCLWSGYILFLMPESPGATPPANAGTPMISASPGALR